MKKAIIVLLFLIIRSVSYSQTNDTIINKKHYSSREYYSSNNSRMNSDREGQPLLSLGNIVNNEKEGHWIYFLQNGRKFAEGYYKNGKKIGKWLFYNGNQDAHITLKYSKKNNLLDQVFVDAYGHLEIRDITEKYNQIIYVNGYAKEATVRFLD